MDNQIHTDKALDCWVKFASAFIQGSAAHSGTGLNDEDWEWFVMRAAKQADMMMDKLRYRCPKGLV